MIISQVQQLPFLLVTFTLNDDELQFNEGVIFSLAEIEKLINTPVEGMDAKSERIFTLLSLGYVDFRGGEHTYNLASNLQVGLDFSNSEFEAEMVHFEQIDQAYASRLEQSLLAHRYQFSDDFLEEIDFEQD